jgi:magnesium chelatase family protein
MAPPTRALLAELAEQDGLSARGVHRVLRVARTIADLAERGEVGPNDVLAAAALREPAGQGVRTRAA